MATVHKRIKAVLTDEAAIEHLIDYLHEREPGKYAVAIVEVARDQKHKVMICVNASVIGGTIQAVTARLESIEGIGKLTCIKQDKSQASRVLVVFETGWKNQSDLDRIYHLLMAQL